MNLKSLKQQMTEKILRAPGNLKIFYEQDREKIENKDAVRLYIVEKNGYLYNQFHSEKNKIDRLGKKYKKYVEKNRFFKKEISPSVGIVFSDSEKEFYEKNRENTEYSEYVCCFDRCKSTNLKEKENDK